MNKTISDYMAKIGREGGKKGKRTWSEDQKKAMVAKKAETLRRKKELRRGNDTITSGR